MLLSRAQRARDYVGGSGLGPYLVRAFMGSGAVQLAGMGLTFLAGVQLARGLGVSGYGYYGLAMAIITMAGIPGEFGLAKLVTREVAAANARGDSATLFGVLRWADRTSLAISAAVIVVLAAGALLFAGGSRSPLTFALLAGALIVPLGALMRIRCGALQGLQFVVLGQIPANVIRPALFSILLLALFTLVPGAGADAAIALSSASVLAALIAAQLWLRRRLPERPTDLVHHPRSWLASSWPMAITNALLIIQGQAAIILLGIVSSAAQVGLFRISVSILSAVAAPSILTGVVTMPVMARLYAEGDMTRLQRLVTRATQAQFAAEILLSIPLFIAAGPLLGLVFGSEFAPAATTLQILLAGQIINAGFGANGNLLLMTGHERRVTRALGLSTPVSALCILLLGSLFGTIGAAFGVIIGQLIWNVIISLDAWRRLGINTMAVRFA